MSPWPQELSCLHKKAIREDNGQSEYAPAAWVRRRDISASNGMERPGTHERTIVSKLGVGIKAWYTYVCSNPGLRGAVHTQFGERRRNPPIGPAQHLQRCARRGLGWEETPV